MSSNKMATKADLQEMYSRILPYLGGSADAGFTPVGTIISVMGVTAPANYLACNGQVVNIADYPELANYFYQQFGSKNKFGGNGTTTFAVPDLRGEFLRGTGTNGHTISIGGETVSCGNGENVGTHQNPTLVPNFQTPSGGDMFFSGYKSTSMYPIANYQESQIKAPDNTANNKSYVKTTKAQESTGGLIKYATRPTNTSVLYCIATKNIYMNPSLDYSTDEKVVGTWIDGKTVFQRTFDCGYGGEAGTNVYTPITSDLSEIETVVDVSGFCRESRGDTWPINTAFINWQTFNVEGFDSVFVTVLGTSPNQYYGIAIRTSDKDLTSCHFYVTVRYTKPTS